jgi:phosphoribosyl 1,2-cyclic phosphodiesterase
MSVMFWGVRGSIPTPGLEKTIYGGNTSCLEIRVPTGEIIVIDGGTGALPLGNKLVKEEGSDPLSIHFFLTHFHWDHIQGIPFFRPLYFIENHVTFYSANPASWAKEALEGQMSVPYFPVDFKFLRKRPNFPS